MNISVALAFLDDVKGIVKTHCSDVDKWYKWINNKTG